MSDPNPFVQADEHGVLRVAASRVMLDSILAAWSEGHSPETIRRQFPSLNLSEIYGAISWSLSHQTEVQAYLKSQDAVWEKWRARSEAEVSPLRQRLRAAKVHAEA